MTVFAFYSHVIFAGKNIEKLCCRTVTCQYSSFSVSDLAVSRHQTATLSGVEEEWKDRGKEVEGGGKNKETEIVKKWPEKVREKNRESLHIGEINE